jgi:hypothetical protein
MRKEDIIMGVQGSGNGAQAKVLAGGAWPAASW